jgi:hypothetical protein
MEEEFLATIKLITGEEIITKCVYLPEEDCLLLENPMEVTYVNQQKKQSTTNGFFLTEWIHSTFDHCFILNKSNVITMTEIEDDRIEKYYLTSVEKHITQLSTVKEALEPQHFSRGMGNLGSVKETKKFLEDLFNRS